MFAPLFRSTEIEEKKKELDNTKRFLYNAGRNRGVHLSRENRQKKHSGEFNVSRETSKEVKNNDTTK